MCNLTVLSLMPNLRARTLLLAPVLLKISIISRCLGVNSISFIINPFDVINDMQSLKGKRLILYGVSVSVPILMYRCQHTNKKGPVNGDKLGQLDLAV